MRVFLDEFDYLIHLIRCAIHGEQPRELPDNLDFEWVYKYGVFHHVANIAFYSVKKLQTKPEASLFQKWEDSCTRAVIQDISQDFAREELLARFRQADIRWLEVQGTRIKKLYPQPEYRAMTDMDFIVDPERLADAEEILKELGYECEHGLEGDINATRRPNLLIELHTGYFHSDSPYHAVMPQPFSSVDSNGECDGKDFYLYNVLHTMKHYYYGGCGIRRVLDLYYLSREFEGAVDIQPALEQAQVAGLAGQMQALAQSWFGDAPWDTPRSELESYLLQSGMHGHIFHHTQHQVQQSLEGFGRLPKGQYFLRRILGTKEIMYASYPILNRHKLLYPLCWIHRGFTALHPSKRNLIRTEIEFVMKKDKAK